MKTDQNRQRTIKNNGYLKKNISIKSLFYGWHEIYKKEVIEYAKMKMKMITMGKNKQHRLDLINNRLKGITLTLKDLEDEV